MYHKVDMHVLSHYNAPMDELDKRIERAGDWVTVILGLALITVIHVWENFFLIVFLIWLASAAAVKALAIVGEILRGGR